MFSFILAIIVPPRSQNITQGEVANFSCTATGEFIIWHVNGVLYNTDMQGILELPMVTLNGSKNLRMSVLSVKGLPYNDNISITCTVTGESVSVRSKIAWLRIQGKFNCIYVYVNLLEPQLHNF